MSETIVSAIDGIVRCGHKKAAIIGAGPGRNDAPWDDPLFCFFAINEIKQPVFHKHFELHPRAVQSPRDLEFLKHCPVPCYVLDLAEWHGLISHPVQFPLERLRAAGFRMYATCTFAYQIMLAILDGFEAIGLWGVELFLGSPRERTVERACVEYWIGFAEGRGVKIVADSGLATHRSRWLYGYDYDKELRAVEDLIGELGTAINQERGLQTYRRRER